MDTTSRKLVRRARMRRNHERQTRAAATKSKRRPLQQPDDAAPHDQWELFENLERHEDNTSIITQSTRSSNIPNLPSLSGSQYMICSTNNDSGSHYNGGPPDKVMKVATPFPSKERPERRTQRRGRPRRTIDECMSDSNVPTTTHWRGLSESTDFEQSGNFSDTAVLNQQRHQGEQESRRVYRRREGRRKTVKPNRGNSNKIIETVLEENITQEVHPKIKPIATVGDSLAARNLKILPKIPSNPPSPSLSRMVQKKTETLNISDNVLEQIKEMSSHLRIVNWLWDSTRVPLNKTGTQKKRGVSPSTTNSSNLVVVRGTSEGNWFDMPRQARQEQLSPISANSDLNSDFEEELMHLL